MAPALPRGTTPRAMAQALSGFRRAVGPSWVFTAESDLAPYGDAFAPDAADVHRPYAAVAPASVEEVQAIVRVASETGVPLWTVSTGRNLAYGGSAPVLPGTVIVDLKRMNRVIEVDEELGYALVEPGVSFFELYRHLEQIGSRLWISSPAPGWGSIMGNALERGFGPTAYGDHSAQVCGLEVVLADGMVLRTGMGAVPGARTWQLFKNGFGPGWDTSFMQSNYGVVTKLGIWLMPRPEAVATLKVELDAEDDLGLAVDVLRPLRLENVMNGISTFRNVTGGAIISGQRSDWYDGPGPIPESVLQAIRRKFDTGWWTLNGSIYGRDEIVRAQAAIARKAFEAVPKARIDVDVLDAKALASPGRGNGGARAGIPSLGALGIVDWRGGHGGHIDFSPILPPRGEDALKVHHMARRIIEQGGQDYMGTLYNFGRSMTLICAIGFNRSKPEETANVQRIFPQLIRELGAAGYGEYRTHIRYMDAVADLYRWNDDALGRFNARIKDALDPAGILSPGKQGIWPKKYRQERKKA